MAESKQASTKKYTKREVSGFLTDLSEHVADSQGNYLHSLIALNELLSQPNAEKLFDSELKAKAKEIWIKLKSSGLELNDPPLLFGAPEGDKGSSKASQGKASSTTKKA